MKKFINFIKIKINKLLTILIKEILKNFKVSKKLKNIYLK